MTESARNKMIDLSHQVDDLPEWKPDPKVPFCSGFEAGYAARDVEKGGMDWQTYLWERDKLTEGHRKREQKLVEALRWITEYGDIHDSHSRKAREVLKELGYE